MDYFDRTYFDPDYFDTDAAAAAGGEGRSGKRGKRRPNVMTLEPPAIVDAEDWITLI